MKATLFRKRFHSIGAKHLAAGFCAALMALPAGCSRSPEPEPEKEEPETVVVQRRVAVAHLSPTEGYSAEGTVSFFEEAGGIRVIADIRGLSESGKHGFHIHEFGDCSASDASSAGGHFNPAGHKHAGPTSNERHAGDLGNLETTDAGGAMYVEFNDALTFDGPGSIIGKSVIVHAGEDDLSSQPSGAAGPRIACGVIEWEEEGELYSGIIW